MKCSRAHAVSFILKVKRDFPGGPVVRSLSSHCRGHRFDPWLGNKDLESHAVKPKFFLVKKTHTPKSREPELQR